MDPLFRIALLAAPIGAAPANADPVQRWRPFIAEASARFGIPAAWIERVMRAERGGRTRLHGEPITSWAGAMGLMQLMPGTWAESSVAHDLGSAQSDPHNNILSGTAYLPSMYEIGRETCMDSECQYDGILVWDDIL